MRLDAQGSSIGRDEAFVLVKGLSVSDLRPGDWCKAWIYRKSDQRARVVRRCQVKEMLGPVLLVTTKTRKGLVAIGVSDVVGYGWGIRPKKQKDLPP